MKLGSEYQDENVTWIRKYAQMDNQASIQGMSFPSVVTRTGQGLHS